ncbi:SRPBCC family protein [candidate division KSB1 bacterium]
MAKFNYKLEINAPVDVVFDIYSDPKYENKWISDCEMKELISGKVDEAGARFKFTRKSFGKLDGEEVIEELTAYKKNELHAVKVISDRGDSSLEVKFHQSGDVTIMNIAAKLRSKNFWIRNFIDPLYLYLYKVNYIRDLQRFKKIVEE